MIELSSNIKKRFCKDFRLPINIYSEPYFEYFIELYDPLLGTKDKLELLHDVLRDCKNQEDFYQHSIKTTAGIKELILNTKAYADFNSRNINEFPLHKNVSQQDIYIPENIGKEMISIDLEKANYNSFRLFGLQEEIGCPTYADLVKKFTDKEYFIQSKMIRQVIFGDLNPSRQQRIQKYIIQNLCEKLLANGCEISSASSDEIIVRNKTDVSEIKDILKDVNEEFKFFRVEKFHFDKVHDDFNYFIKTTNSEDGNDQIEFKNTPSFVYAQVFKEQFKLPTNGYDMLFYHEGYLAEFKEPMFTSMPKNKAKP